MSEAIVLLMTAGVVMGAWNLIAARQRLKDLERRRHARRRK